VAGAPENHVHWVKSSFSGADNCVELAFVEPDTVLVRDSKDPDGGVLRFDGREWDAFLSGAKAGEFER
jgi:hypothetical protein